MDAMSYEDYLHEQQSFVAEKNEVDSNERPPTYLFKGMDWNERAANNGKTLEGNHYWSIVQGGLDIFQSKGAGDLCACRAMYATEDYKYAALFGFCQNSSIIWEAASNIEPALKCVVARFGDLHFSEELTYLDLTPPSNEPDREAIERDIDKVSCRPFLGITVPTLSLIHI